MEPEDGFHEHLNGSDKIVPAADMAKFVCDDGFPLLGSQVLKEAFGHQQNRPKDSEDTRLQEGRRRYRPDRKTKRQRRSGADSGADPPPANPPRNRNADEPA